MSYIAAFSTLAGIRTTFSSCTPIAHIISAACPSRLLPRSSFLSTVHGAHPSISRRARTMVVTSVPTATAAAGADTSASVSHGFDYDLLVLGAGSGGVRAARIAATHGARVAIAEYQALGGTCVNVGCVPKKLFVYGSHFSHDFHDAEAYGWNVPEPTLQWPRLIKNKNAEIERLNGVYGRVLANAGVELKVGTAVFVDPHTVTIGESTVTADKILIAVGGRPSVPDIPGSEHVITSNEAFYLKDLPKRVIIVGGGYIGVEFACILHSYGAEVTQVVRRELFLNGFDEDLRLHLAEQMKLSGVNLRFKSKIEKIVKADDGTLTATLNDGSTVDADLIMFATGRVPNTTALNLEAVGVNVGGKGEIVVDKWSKTNVDHIWAVGDVTDRVNLTPVAIAEGHAFADTVFGNKPRHICYENIPTAVFSQPPIGTCGLTEAKAREKYGQNGISVFKTSFRPMKHTLTKREGEKVFMKLLVEKATDKVVGCHMIDAAAGEVIQLVGVAMKAGATKEHFDTTMPVHPVSAEELVTMRTPVPE